MAYVDRILAEAGLVSYFRLGEAAGAVAENETAVADGTYMNAPTLGVVGAIRSDEDTAVTFNGTDEYVAAGDTSVGEGADATIEAWVKFTTAATAYVALEARASTAQPRFGIYVDAGVAHIFYRTDAGGTIDLSGGGAINNDRWHHVVAVKDGAAGLLRLFVDGVQVDTDAIPAGALTLDHLAIAASRSAGFTALAFPGSIDEVAIYSDNLDAAAIRDHYWMGRGADVHRRGATPFVRGIEAQPNSLSNASGGGGAAPPTTGQLWPRGNA